MTLQEELLKSLEKKLALLRQEKAFLAQELKENNTRGKQVRTD